MAFKSRWAVGCGCGPLSGRYLEPNRYNMLLAQLKGNLIATSPRDIVVLNTSLSSAACPTAQSSSAVLKGTIAIVSFKVGRVTIAVESAVSNPYDDPPQERKRVK